MKKVSKSTFVVQKKVINFSVPILFALLVNFSCDKDEVRTTTIHGTVTDQDNQPVDSILVTASGLWDLHVEIVKQAYTDENGNYELVVDAAKKYSKLNAGIPYFPVENPKFQSHYDIEKIWKNEEQTSNCCTASIGQKTKYDFQLKYK